ncbi:hypothetical protein EDC04DRAFT_1520703 [Pisolithus marmoratus]|nr:hypothetical protein EDC04DRAFT_1520703 [Pisolithus marmoratus]
MGKKLDGNDEVCFFSFTVLSDNLAIARDTLSMISAKPTHSAAGQFLAVCGEHRHLSWLFITTAVALHCYIIVRIFQTESACKHSSNLLLLLYTGWVYISPWLCLSPVRPGNVRSLPTIHDSRMTGPLLLLPPSDQLTTDDESSRLRDFPNDFSASSQQRQRSVEQNRQQSPCQNELPPYLAKLLLATLLSHP